MSEINDTNAAWRRYHEEMRERSKRAGAKATDRIDALARDKKLVAVWHTAFHVTLSHPDTRSAVDFYPTRGTIVRLMVRQHRRGLDAALKLIGVRE